MDASCSRNLLDSPGGAACGAGVWLCRPGRFKLRDFGQTERISRRDQVDSLREPLKIQAAEQAQHLAGVAPGAEEDDEAAWAPL